MLLAIGLVANSRIRARASGSKPPRVAHAVVVADVATTVAVRPAGWRLALHWTVVALPMAWGVAEVAAKSAALFR